MSLKDNAHVFPYCPFCRAGMGVRLEGGTERPACPECGFVQYLNPAPGAAVIIRRGKKVCLVQRKFEPKKGMWTLPTGFMEWNEDAPLAAAREALEETGLVVKITRLHSVESGLLPPDIPVLVVFFQGKETGGQMVAGDDAAAVGFFDLDDLPGPIAFASHLKTLNSLGKEIL